MPIAEAPVWGALGAIATAVSFLLAKRWLLPAQRRKIEAEAGSETASGTKAIVEAVGLLAATSTDVLRVIQSQRDAALAKVSLVEIELETIKQVVTQMRVEYRECKDKLTEFERQSNELLNRSAAKLPRPKR